MPPSDYPTSVLEGKPQKCNKLRWNLTQDFSSSFRKKTSSSRPLVILYGEKRVAIWVVASMHSLWISDEDISKYRSTSRVKNRLHVPWTLGEEASVLVNLIEKNGHVVSSLAQDRVVQHFAQPVRLELAISFAKASPYQGQDNVTLSRDHVLQLFV